MRKRLNKEKLRHEKEKLQGRIWAYAELGMKKEAIKGCRELIMLDKDDPQAYMELGVTHADGGDIEKAIRCYKFAIELFPGYSRYYVNLGHIFERHKKRDDIAMICYEKALELDSDDEWALNNVGAVLTKEGRWEEGLLIIRID